MDFESELMAYCETCPVLNPGGVAAVTVDVEDHIGANGPIQKFLDYIEKLLVDAGVDLPPKQQVLDTVSKLYDQYVAPLTPDYLGPLTDVIIKRIVLIAVGKIYDRIAAKQ